METLPAIDAGLARRLVDTQFPQWAGLPMRRLDPAGSDHVIYRLGDELAVRLPRHPGAVGQAEKELERGRAGQRGHRLRRARPRRPGL